MAEIVTTSIKSLPLVYRGKVRDSYAVAMTNFLLSLPTVSLLLTSSSAIRSPRKAKF